MFGGSRDKGIPDSNFCDEQPVLRYVIYRVTVKKVSFWILQMKRKRILPINTARRLLFMPMLMNRSIEKEYLRLNRMKLREIVEREIADDNNSSKNREKISATQLEVEDEGTKNNFEMGDFVKMMRDRLQLLEKKQVQKSGTRRTNATKRCAQPPKTKAKRRRKEATPESTSESGSDFISDVEMESSGSESESESEEEDGEVVCDESDLLDGSIESDSSDHDDEQREERFDSSADETSHPMHDKR
ncbi:unnamed protein product [Anisakis simplex]|uniref:Uncharacterized protein n=1 Tax=Anisakis simplex TaxID=6269 RepID=A0A0M3IZJ1_ANISI|nr:unnamed protein product [Anisakis simplex]